MTIVEIILTLEDAEKAAQCLFDIDETRDIGEEIFDTIAQYMQN